MTNFYFENKLDTKIFDNTNVTYKLFDIQDMTQTANANTNTNNWPNQCTQPIIYQFTDTTTNFEFDQIEQLAVIQRTYNDDNVFIMANGKQYAINYKRFLTVLKKSVEQSVFDELAEILNEKENNEQ